MQENQSVSISVQSERWSKQSIYRIPPSVTELNKKAYKPQIVSFGPYHHGMEHLMAMEEHKHRALDHFSTRANKTLQSLVDDLTPFLQDLKAAYDQLDKIKCVQDNDGFLKMMVIDGCFILEILRTARIDDHSQSLHQPQAQSQSSRHSQSLHQPQPQAQSQSSTDQTASSYQDYASNDPIFSRHGKLYFVPYLKRDMLMLENQIPMKVLEVLASINPLEKKLTALILEFFSQRVPPNEQEEFMGCKYMHILDVYRKSLLLLPKPPKNTGNYTKGGKGEDQIIRSATELHEAGIYFNESKTRSLKDITFHGTICGGILKLPRIVVDDATESLYLNMIAYERFHVGAGNEVTSYIYFMDNIIDNSRDVSLLHSSRIIQNALGSEKAVANLFNSLSKDITLDPENPLDKVHQQVSEYCQRKLPTWRAALWHKWFTNPWAIISFFAAILLFVLTILQTVYTVLPNVHPKSNQ